LHDYWDTWSHVTATAYNNVVHSSTGSEPSLLHMGFGIHHPTVEHLTAARHNHNPTSALHVARYSSLLERANNNGQTHRPVMTRGSQLRFSSVP
jgi:hypothetical protein